MAEQRKPTGCLRFQLVPFGYGRGSAVIEIYVNDMENRHMTATDNTFDRGRIGIGQFDDMNDFINIRVYGL